MLERQRTKNSPKPKNKVIPGLQVRVFSIPLDTLAQNQCNFRLHHGLNSTNIHVEIVDYTGRSCANVGTVTKILDLNTIEIDTRNITTGLMVRITA